MSELPVSECSLADSLGRSLLAQASLLDWLAIHYCCELFGAYHRAAFVLAIAFTGLCWSSLLVALIALRFSARLVMARSELQCNFVFRDVSIACSALKA